MPFDERMLLSFWSYCWRNWTNFDRFRRLRVLPCFPVCHPLSKLRAVWSSTSPPRSKEKLSGVPRWAFIFAPLSVVQMTGQLAAQSEWGWVTWLKLLKKTRECLRGHGEQCEGEGWSEKAWLCLKLLSMIEKTLCKTFLTNKIYYRFAQWALKAPEGMFEAYSNSLFEL